MEDSQSNGKYLSRKFIVWIIATLFEAAAIVWGFISKEGSLAEQFTPYWGWISICYIGGNVAQDFVFNLDKKTTTAQNTTEETK